MVMPVEAGGETAAHVVVAGFVGSTRERRRLYEHLLARGIREESARLALRAMPVVGRRQAEAYAEVALSSAQAALAAEMGRAASTQPSEDMTIALAAGKRALRASHAEPQALGELVSDALTIVGADGGALYLPRRGAMLEVVATGGSWPAEVGSRIERDGTLAGKAMKTRRSVLSADDQRDSARAFVALPVSAAGRVLGVLEVSVRPDVLPLPADRLGRLEGFLRFFALTLAAAAEREQQERGLATQTVLNELSAALGRKTELDEIAAQVSATLEKSFRFDVAGLAVTSHGVDRADVILRRDVSECELDLLLGEASGRDIATEPIDALNIIDRGGSVQVAGQARDAWATLAVELDGDDITVGYLFVATADGVPYDATDRQLLEGMAAHVATALERAALFHRVRDDYASTIAALSSSLDPSHEVQRGHGGHVMDYAMLIGQELGLPFEQVEQLRFAGLLHDIGIRGLSEEIVVSPSRLTTEEMTRAARRTQREVDVVEQIAFLKELTPAVLHHHESWDGSGYPMGLAGEDIPLLSRVLAVADGYDDLTSARSGSGKRSRAAARAEIESAAGSRYDPRVVEALGAVLDRQALAGATGLITTSDAERRPDLFA